MNLLLTALSIVGLITVACHPIQEFHRVDRLTDQSLPPETDMRINSQKKTIVILADPQGTELFDFLAPYSLFSSTGLYNVLVATPTLSTIPLWKGMHVVPHTSLDQLATPDLIVVPALFEPKNEKIQQWLSKQPATMQYLSVCEGARVLAESRRFANRSIATHHASVAKLSREYPKMNWTKGYRHVVDHSLISTAGVSAATEGTLKAIELLSGKAVQCQAMKYINYPAEELVDTMMVSQLRFGDQLRIARKTAFGNNPHLLVFLPGSFDEFRVGAIIDTYNRTFPRSIASFSANNEPVISRHGLIVYPTASVDTLNAVNEIIVPLPKSDLSSADREYIETLGQRWGCPLRFYEKEEYIFDLLYQDIAERYGQKYAHTVFRLLDANLSSYYPKNNICP